MSSEMYSQLVLPLCEEHRIRCIASDRRGFGKSQFAGSKPIEGGVTYDTLAADTVAFLKAAQVGNFVLVGASMGAGETVLAFKQMDKALKDKCRGFIWLGPSLPYPVQTNDNPKAPSMELWKNIAMGLRADRVGFAREGLKGVIGTNLNIGVEVKDTVMERFEGIINQADALAIERCIDIITNKDFRGELKTLDRSKRILVLHGDNDKGMPAEASAHLINDYAEHAVVKIYENSAHGLYLTHAERVIEDILAFVLASEDPLPN